MNYLQSVRRDERGMNALMVPLIVSVFFLVVTAGFAIWAFMGRQDYKDNVDQKIEAAVAVAVKETKTEKDVEFAEKEKAPLKAYQGPSDAGSITIMYPKTWSAYVDSSGRGSATLDGYFHPTTVPGVSSGASYALRLQVVDRSFSEEVRSFDSQIKNGSSSAVAYQPVNVGDVVGVRITGQIDSQKQGIIILLPLRDKTIKLFTESDQFYNDFDNNILPNFRFSP